MQTPLEALHGVMDYQRGREGYSGGYRPTERRDGYGRGNDGYRNTDREDRSRDTYAPTMSHQAYREFSLNMGDRNGLVPIHQLPKIAKRVDVAKPPEDDTLMSNSEIIELKK